jgi:tRNA(Ile)-lysidine synthetase-like protein
LSFSAATLAGVLDRLIPSDATGLVVALSGGLDSSCLATALAELAARGVLPAQLPLRAVHVDHGLQGAAVDFRAASGALCERLRLALDVVTLSVALPPGSSIEAEARDARYRALAAQLRPGECLLSAHHGDDQAETFLLQALRGAGPKGLASMPERRALGPGWQLRPLLGVTRRDLEAYAASAGIEPTLDPMNRDRRFDRAYLRHELWPLLEQRWPGAATALARSARHSAEAQQLLDALADDDLATLRDGEALSAQALRRLGETRRLNALRRWLSVDSYSSPAASFPRSAERASPPRPRRDPRGARPEDRDGQARPVHQRRSGHDEPVPARRGVRHRRRHRDRPGSGALRALRAHDHRAQQQFHHRAHLRARHRQGAPRRLPRRDRAGHPAHHR